MGGFSKYVGNAKPGSAMTKNNYHKHPKVQEKIDNMIFNKIMSPGPWPLKKQLTVHRLQ
jgi:hypothetical protein